MLQMLQLFLEKYLNDVIGCNYIDIIVGSKMNIKRIGIFVCFMFIFYIIFNNVLGKYK